MNIFKFKPSLFLKVAAASILSTIGLLAANTSVHASAWFFMGEPKMPESLILKQNKKSL